MARNSWSAVYEYFLDEGSSFRCKVSVGESRNCDSCIPKLNTFVLLSAVNHKFSNG